MNKATFSRAKSLKASEGNTHSREKKQCYSEYWKQFLGFAVLDDGENCPVIRNKNKFRTVSKKFEHGHVSFLTSKNN